MGGSSIYESVKMGSLSYIKLFILHPDFISGAENLKPTVSLPIGVIRKLIFRSYNLKLFSNAIL